ncbi:hypothetical protein Dip510_001614 [Elusimicrobium posterum]|uniref:DUF1351 domain-containing protein n=1 Tax=Elusimicrobium posterum TaxID=3116653 RepID=UPI003C77D04C
MTMELVIHTPSDKFLNAIEFNYDQLRGELKNALAKYENMIVTEDGIKLAKKDRANLNKFKDALSAKRKEIKAKCLKPYEDFEAKMKELEAMVEVPTANIDEQIKVFEDAKKAEKKAELEAFYNKTAGAELMDVLPFERVFNSKWLNTTVGIDTAMTEVFNIVGGVKADLATIKDLKTEFEAVVQDKYIQTLNLSTALNENKRLIEHKAKMEALEAKRAEEMAAMAKAKAPAPTPAAAPVPEPVTPAPAADPVVTQPQEKVYTFKFQVTATCAQLEALKKCLVENQINYKKVD